MIKVKEQDKSQSKIETIEEQQTELYKNVGLIVHISQMIEYNLANILAFDEMLRPFEKNESYWDFEVGEFHKRADDLYDEICDKPLGTILGKTKEKGIFQQVFIDKLDSVRERRNRVIHIMFKDDIKEHHVGNDPTFYSEEIESLIADMIYVNTVLVEVFKMQKSEFDLIW